MSPVTRFRTSPKRASGVRRPSAYVGEWELLTLLGQGEWSSVFRGRPRECSNDRPADYAIKVGRCDDRKLRQVQLLFAREAAIGQTVTHPNLVAVLSGNVEGATPYIVMPLMEGATLQAALAAHGPLATPHALWLARQVAEALIALHESGWIHADIKPSNIYVAPTGHATLIDLGFALRLGTEECAAGGSLRGTLSYTAPEMISPAVSVDGRCDVYSLGATLYELITGRPPFTGADPDSLLLAHLQQPAPNPRRLKPMLFHAVAQLLRDVLAKEPLRRPDARELVDRLIALEIATFSERAA